MKIALQIPTEQLLAEYIRSRAPELREQIVTAHLPIAGMIARKFSGRGVDYDDLYQVAALALFKGIDRFDPDKGIKFVSFITPTMVGEVKNYFRDRSRTIRLPRRGVELAAKARAARAVLEQELGRSPTLDELAEHMGLDEAELIEALETSGAGTPVSLDAQVAEDDDDAPLSKFFGFSDAGYAEFEQADMLRRAMAALDDRQREVIRYRYFENMSQREVSQIMNLSQMTVSRVERQALTILRGQVADEDTGDTL